MKNYLLSLYFIIGASPMFAQTDTVKIQTTPTDSLMYTCPMHPEITSDKPGKCPKCGMDLAQNNSSSSEHKMNMMMCPMHGMTDINHKHDKEKKDNKKTMMKDMGIGMGIIMVVVMTVMILIK